MPRVSIPLEGRSPSNGVYWGFLPPTIINEIFKKVQKSCGGIFMVGGSMLRSGGNLFNPALFVVSDFCGIRKFDEQTKKPISKDGLSVPRFHKD